MAELDGKVAIVTGGGRGIGRAVALALARSGAAVALTGRSREHLERVVAEVQSSGGIALAIPGDVADAEAVQSTVARVRAERGAIDILVNNAGITASVKFAETDDATWERIMLVNVTGPFRYCRAVIGDMLARRSGRIINIASIAALSGIPYSSAYSASKHALLGLTRSLALEYGRVGITANALCPGWTETDMLSATIENIMAKTGRSADEARASILALSGQTRFVTAEEVAEAALALAGPDGAATNGAAITIAP
jgi:NAD(P)-dependent dehydrogenase (short-subunit alcohol dehydrogenase family)